MGMVKILHITFVCSLYKVCIIVLWPLQMIKHLSEVPSAPKYLVDFILNIKDMLNFLNLIDILRLKKRHQRCR